MCPARTDRGWTEKGKRRHSLVVRMLLAVIVAGCVINLIVGGFFRMMFGKQTHPLIVRNAIHYAHNLAAEIGAPPDTLKARALARDMGLRIRVEGPPGSGGVLGAGAGGVAVWESHPGTDFPEKAFQHHRHGPEEGWERAGWCRGGPAVRVQEGGQRFYFAFDMHKLGGAWAGGLGLLISLLCAVLVVAFLAMRRMMSPLRRLTAAVERLGQGELGHQVEILRHRKDELSELARAFNAMSTRLKEMLRSREQLLLDVSHELRSPLTRLKVALEMAPEGATKESMKDDLAEMEVMVSEILEAARLDSAPGRLQLEETDLRALAEEAIKAANGRAPGVRLGSLGGSPRLKLDRERARKVIGNVLDNALKYSRDQDRPVEVEILPGDAEVTLRVRDHGPGIPEADLPRLFEPFYRVDRSRSRDTGGYGLGLSLCKRIMEAHGGRIAIASPPPGARQGGTEVSLVFPFSAA